MGESGDVIIGPEMHEEEMRGIIDHVTVERGDFNAVIPHGLENGVDFLTQQHEITGNGSLAAPVGWKLIAIAVPMEGGMPCRLQ